MTDSPRADAVEDGSPDTSRTSGTPLSPLARWRSRAGGSQTPPASAPARESLDSPSRERPAAVAERVRVDGDAAPAAAAHALLGWSPTSAHSSSLSFSRSVSAQQHQQLQQLQLPASESPERSRSPRSAPAVAAAAPETPTTPQSDLSFELESRQSQTDAPMYAQRAAPDANSAALAQAPTAARGWEAAGGAASDGIGAKTGTAAAASTPFARQDGATAPVPTPERRPPVDAAKISAQWERRLRVENALSVDGVRGGRGRVDGASSVASSSAAEVADIVEAYCAKEREAAAAREELARVERQLRCEMAALQKKLDDEAAARAQAERDVQDLLGSATSPSLSPQTGALGAGAAPRASAAPGVNEAFWQKMKEREDRARERVRKEFIQESQQRLYAEQDKREKAEKLCREAERRMRTAEEKTSAQAAALQEMQLGADALKGALSERNVRVSELESKVALLERQQALHASDIDKEKKELRQQLVDARALVEQRETALTDQRALTQDLLRDLGVKDKDLLERENLHDGILSQVHALQERARQQREQLEQTMKDKEAAMKQELEHQLTTLEGMKQRCVQHKARAEAAEAELARRQSQFTVSNSEYEAQQQRLRGQTDELQVEKRSLELQLERVTEAARRYAKESASQKESERQARETLARRYSAELSAMQEEVDRVALQRKRDQERHLQEVLTISAELSLVKGQNTRFEHAVNGLLPNRSEAARLLAHVRQETSSPRLLMPHGEDDRASDHTKETLMQVLDKGGRASTSVPGRASVQTASATTATTATTTMHDSAGATSQNSPSMFGLGPHHHRLSIVAEPQHPLAPTPSMTINSSRHSVGSAAGAGAAVNGAVAAASALRIAELEEERAGLQTRLAAAKERVQWLEAQLQKAVQQLQQQQQQQRSTSSSAGPSRVGAAPTAASPAGSAELLRVQKALREEVDRLNSERAELLQQLEKQQRARQQQQPPPLSSPAYLPSAGAGAGSAASVRDALVAMVNAVEQHTAARQQREKHRHPHRYSEMQPPYGSADATDEDDGRGVRGAYLSRGSGSEELGDPTQRGSAVHGAWVVAKADGTGAVHAHQLEEEALRQVHASALAALDCLQGKRSGSPFFSEEDSSFSRTQSKDRRPRAGQAPEDAPDPQRRTDALPPPLPPPSATASACGERPPSLVSHTSSAPAARHSAFVSSQQSTASAVPPRGPTRALPLPHAQREDDDERTELESEPCWDEAAEDAGQLGGGDGRAPAADEGYFRVVTSAAAHAAPTTAVAGPGGRVSVPHSSARAFTELAASVGGTPGEEGVAADEFTTTDGILRYSPIAPSLVQSSEPSWSRASPPYSQSARSSAPAQRRVQETPAELTPELFRNIQLLSNHRPVGIPSPADDLKHPRPSTPPPSQQSRQR